MFLKAQTTRCLIVLVLVGLAADTFLFAYFIANEVGRAVTAGVFAGLFGALQWLVALTRERERSTWAAVQAYYSEGDSSEIRACRQKIRDGTATDPDRAAVLSFY